MRTDVKFKLPIWDAINGPRITHLGSYPPRECGIATFSRDLTRAIDRLNPLAPTQVVAVREDDAFYDYGPEVSYEIARDDPESYRMAADFVNLSRADLVSIQHEFGLFGGEYGSHLTEFVQRLRKPAVVTLHTVLPNPPGGMRAVIQALSSACEGVVVLAEAAVDILEQHYGLPREKLRAIPHGAPNVSYQGQGFAKRALGLEGRTILSSFGLINPGKGIEYALKALPEVVKRFPNVLYLVLGETHPGVRMHSGESYRVTLEKMVGKLGLGRHVRFSNRYLADHELVTHLLATDVYLMPYLNPAQIVSGTLAYAVACGRAIICTPFTYARELLADGRGLLVDFRSSQQMSAAMLHLLENPAERECVQRAAHAYGRRMVWSAVAHNYRSFFGSAISAHRRRLRTIETAARQGKFAS